MSQVFALSEGFMRVLCDRGFSANVTRSRSSEAVLFSLRTFRTETR